MVINTCMQQTNLRQNIIVYKNTTTTSDTWTSA